MKIAPLLPLAVAAGLLLPATGAQAAARLGPVNYEIVKATHHSEISRSETDYQGHSTASWSLRRPSRFRISWMPGGQLSGMGRVDVRGSYAIDATTSVPGHCAFTAPTGDAEHPLTAPAPFQLSVAPDARRPGMALVGFQAVQATLKNAYLGTECASYADEPQWEETQTLDVAPARLRGKTITLRFAGTRATGAVRASWRTEIVLERVR